MNVRVLAFYGSPKRNSNTDILMDEFLKGISRDGGVEINRVFVTEMNIKPCNGCGYCEKEGVCNIQDDMQKIYPLMETSHIIAVSSPVYFFGISSQCKAMIDRTHVYWARKYVLNRQWSGDDELIRQGVFLTAAGTHNPELFIGGDLTIRYFFDCLDIVYKGAITVKGVQNFAQVKKHPAELKKAYNMGVELMNPTV